MTNDRNTTPAADRDRQDSDDSNQVLEFWDVLAINLQGCLESLAEGQEGDHLRLELIGPEPEGAGPDLYPYVQFSSTEVPGALQAEIPGNVLIHPLYTLDRDECVALRQMGWFGNDPSGEIDWILDFVDVESAVVARETVSILRDFFGIAHPELLTFRASGVMNDIEEQLGLCASAEVPIDKPTLATFDKPDDSTVTGTDTFVASSHDELVARVAEVLAGIIDDEPEIDDDGDFVIRHMDQIVWVRVLDHQPGIQILARVAHGVESPRAAAVEVSILNRDADWVTWSLRGRDIWQSVLIPAMPFVPAHLDGLLPVFLGAMAATRDDLILRTGAQVG